MVEELRTLLSQGYEVINDLNNAADVTFKQKALAQNGCLAQDKAKTLTKNLHGMIDSFGNMLEKYITGVVKDRAEVLDSHSSEIIENVEFISDLCINAEKLLHKNPKPSSLLEVKAQFVQILKECEDLKYVDYDTFTSVDLEVSLEDLLRPSFVNIISKDAKNKDKHILHKLGLQDLLSYYQDSLSDNDNNPSVSASHQDEEDPLASANVTKCYQNQDKISKTPLIEPTIKIEQVDEAFQSMTVTGENTFSKFQTDNNYLNQTQNNNVHSCAVSREKPSRSDCQNWRENRPDLSGVTQSPLRKPSEKTASILSSSPGQSKIAARFSQANELSTSANNKCDTANKNSDIPPLVCEWTSSSSVQDSQWREAKSQGSICQSRTFTNSAIKVKGNETGRTDTASKEEKVHDEWHSSSSQQINKGPDVPFMNFNLRNLITYHPTVGVAEIKGTLVKTYPEEGQEAFSFPTGVTVRRDGVVVVADTGNNQVRFIRDNIETWSVGLEQGVKFKRPSAIVCDSEDNVYVKDDFCVQVFDVNGKKTYGFGQYRYPFGLALTSVSSKTHAVVIDQIRANAKVYSYSIPDKQMTNFPYEPLAVHGHQDSKVRFFAAHKNSMLTSDLGSSMMYLSNLEGKLLKVFGNYGSNFGEFREPSGVAVDGEGNWLVGDSKNNRIQVFTNQGMYLAMLNLSTPLRRPSGIHLTSDGHLYVINYLDAFIQVFKLHS